MKRVITYGTFDLIHYGHINLLERAKKMGDYLIVALSTNKFNEEKNKKCYFSFEERKRLLEAIRYVDLVIPEECWEQKRKDIGFFDSATSSVNNYTGLKVITTQTDLVTATSRFSRLTLSGMFAMDPRKVKETGYPRNDIMFNSNAKEELQKLVDIDIKKSKLFFYLPTMRKGLKDEGEHFENNIFNYPDYDVDKLDSFLELNNAYIVAKVHFADNELYSRSDFKLPQRLIFLDTEMMNQNMCTIYHILDAFNGLITDYSSIYVDFLLLDKPIIFSCPDIEKYKIDRGFIVDEPEMMMPGAIVKNQEQLMASLSEVVSNNDVYKNRRKEIMPFFHNHIDGKSSERLLSEMINIDVSNMMDSGKQVGHMFMRNASPLEQYVKNEVYSEIFIDRGNGFNETDKIVKKIKLYNIDNFERTSIEFNIDESIKKIRFDPDDIGRAVISELEIYCGEERIYNYRIIGGYEYNQKLFFTDVDPQIIIDIDVKDKCKMKLIFTGYDFYTTGTKSLETMLKGVETSKKVICENELKIASIQNELASIQNELASIQNELDRVYSSKSWKITAWYRKLGDFIKARINRK